MFDKQILSDQRNRSQGQIVRHFQAGNSKSQIKEVLGNAGQRQKELSVKIETTQGVWETTFDKNTKIHEVIQAVVQHFGFAPNGNYELRMAKDPDTPLQPERPLVSYHIQDGDILIFTDLGVAV